MRVKLDYYDRVDRTSIHSKLVKQIEIDLDTESEVFELFYKKNNQLKYCSGSYWKFSDQNWEQKYLNWLKSPDYKSKSWDLYYGGGIVD